MNHKNSTKIHQKFNSSLFYLHNKKSKILSLNNPTSLFIQTNFKSQKNPLTLIILLKIYHSKINSSFLLLSKQKSYYKIQKLYTNITPNQKR